MRTACLLKRFYADADTTSTNTGKTPSDGSVNKHGYACKALQDVADKISISGGDMALNEHVFKKAKGFVVYFNKEGIEQLKLQPDYAFLYPFLETLRDETCNAFVMNVLAVAPMPTGHDIAAEAKVAQLLHFDAVNLLECVRQLKGTWTTLWTQTVHVNSMQTQSVCSMRMCHREFKVEI